MTRRLVMGAYISPHGTGERPRKDRLGELLALAVGLLDFHRYLEAVVRVDPTLARLDTPTLEAFLVFDPAHVRLWELLDGPDSVALRFIARNLPDAYRARQAPAFDDQGLDDQGRPLYEVATIRHRPAAPGIGAADGRGVRAGARVHGARGGAGDDRGRRGRGAGRHGRRGRAAQSARRRDRTRGVDRRLTVG